MVSKAETAIVRSVLGALEVCRVWCWRENSGTIVVGKGRERRVVRLAPPGTPDILGFLSSGRGFGLEVKTKTGRQSKSQKLWQAKAERRGVRYAVVRSYREALAIYDSWEAHERLYTARKAA